MAAGVVVASAKWVYMEDATVGDLTTAMPKPSKETSKRWSMRTCDNDTTLRLFLAPDPSKEGATGFAALAAELLGK